MKAVSCNFKVLTKISLAFELCTLRLRNVSLL